jgi:hypothetical protein
MEELKCVDCGMLPPETESAYTLIGGKAGWRLTRHRSNEGLIVAEWRCPDCWAKFKRANPAGALPGGAPPRSGFGGQKQHDSISPGGRRRGE